MQLSGTWDTTMDWDYTIRLVLQETSAIYLRVLTSNGLDIELLTKKWLTNYFCFG